jgi:hypothetical protein
MRLLRICLSSTLRTRLTGLSVDSGAGTSSRRDARLNHMTGLRPAFDGVGDQQVLDFGRIAVCLALLGPAIPRSSILPF